MRLLTTWFLPHLGAALTFLLAPSPAVAQTVVDELVGNADDLFGFAIVRLVDLDGDGVDEFAVGAPGIDGGTRKGKVHVYSGADRSWIYTFKGPTTGDEFGYSLALVGDMDGDGTRDLLIGCPSHDASPTDLDRGRYYLYSLATGTHLRNRAGPANQASRFGHSVGDESPTGFRPSRIATPEALD